MLDESRERAGEIVARMRSGEIRRDPGPRQGLRGHDICPSFCEFAPICRRDRAPAMEDDEEVEDRREPARPDARAGGGDPDLRTGRAAGGGRRDRQDGGDGRPLLPAGLRRGSFTRRRARLHLHRQGGGGAAPADRRGAGGASRGGVRAGASAAGRDRRRLGDDHPRLLQPPAGRPPGRGRDRPPLPRARRAGGRAGGAGGVRRSSGGLPRRRRGSRREETVAAFGIDGLRALDRRRPRGAAQPWRRRAAAAGAAPARSGGGDRARGRGRRRDAGGAESERPQAGAARESALRAHRQRRRPAVARPAGRAADRQQGEGHGRLPRGDRRRGRPHRRGRRGRACLSPRRAAPRALLHPLRGGQGPPRRDRLRGPADPRRRACWSEPRSAPPIARASATCWSTSSRTPTDCSFA